MMVRKMLLAVLISGLVVTSAISMQDKPVVKKELRASTVPDALKLTRELVTEVQKLEKQLRSNQTGAATDNALDLHIRINEIYQVAYLAEKFQQNDIAANFRKQADKLNTEIKKRSLAYGPATSPELLLAAGADLDDTVRRRILKEEKISDVGKSGRKVPPGKAGRMDQDEGGDKKDEQQKEKEQLLKQIGELYQKAAALELQKNTAEASRIRQEIIDLAQENDLNLDATVTQTTETDEQPPAPKNPFTQRLRHVKIRGEFLQQKFEHLSQLHDLDKETQKVFVQETAKLYKDLYSLGQVMNNLRRDLARTNKVIKLK